MRDDLRGVLGTHALCAPLFSGKLQNGRFRESPKKRLCEKGQNGSFQERFFSAEKKPTLQALARSSFVNAK